MIFVIIGGCVFVLVCASEPHPHPYTMLFGVNDESIELLRYYHVEAAAITNPFITGIKLEFISH